MSKNVKAIKKNSERVKNANKLAKELREKAPGKTYAEYLQQAFKFMDDKNVDVNVNKEEDIKMNEKSEALAHALAKKLKEKAPGQTYAEYLEDAYFIMDGVNLDDIPNEYIYAKKDVVQGENKEEDVKMKKKNEAIEKNSERVRNANALARELREKAPGKEYNEYLEQAFAIMDGKIVDASEDMDAKNLAKKKKIEAAKEKNSERMRNAHKLAKELREKAPGKAYAEYLQQAFKFMDGKNVDANGKVVRGEVVDADAKNLAKKKKEENAKMKKVLNRTEVEVNNKKVMLGMTFRNNKMFGIINNTRFVWDYTNYAYPIVQVKDKARSKEAAVLGRSFIEKRLEMDAVKLEIKKTEPQAPKYTLLKTEEVIVNNIARNVAIQIEGNKMFGVLNNTRFIWDYTNYAYPVVQVKEGVDKLKAAKYARLFIIERLNKDNVKLNIKTFEKKVNYIHIEKKDGVWINAFENRYLRGQVDGVNFVWNTSRYSVAQAVTEAGNKGSYINTSIDVNRIKERLKSEGFTCFNHLFASITPATSMSKNPFGANTSNESNVAISDDKAVAV